MKNPDDIRPEAAQLKHLPHLTTDQLSQNLPALMPPKIPPLHRTSTPSRPRHSTCKNKKSRRKVLFGSGGGSEEGLGKELPQMGEGQREGNKNFRQLRSKSVVCRSAFTGKLQALAI